MVLHLKTRWRITLFGDHFQSKPKDGGEKKGEKKREENTPGSPGALTQKVPQHCSPSCPSNVLVVPLFPTQYLVNDAMCLQASYGWTSERYHWQHVIFWEKPAIFGQHFDSRTSTE